MPPIAMSREYFAELLEIGKSKAPQTERLQKVELVVEQFPSELESVEDVEAESQPPHQVRCSCQQSAHRRVRQRVGQPRPQSHVQLADSECGAR